MKALALAALLAVTPLLGSAWAETKAPGGNDGAAPVHAAKVGNLSVTSAWLRATPNGAPVAGGYATIRNLGDQPDRLIGASIPMAPKGEVHSMSMANGVMHMQRLDHGLEIAPGASVTLEPNGYHLMFMNPTARLKEGESVAGSLTFSKSGTIPVTFAVAGMAAKSAPRSSLKGGFGGRPDGGLY